MLVLIVEDATTIATLVKIYLVGWNLEFQDAGNGREALALARVKRPDLIISDIRMPDMDGFQLCSTLRSDKVLHDVPVILITALQDEESERMLRMVGATAFLKKPVGVNKLREIVGRILRLPSVNPTGVPNKP
ncbi:MAG: response regulator [Myxococcaceae bacterium]